jgi:tetratricopeptide (TPR) repeat protein
MSIASTCARAAAVICALSLFAAPEENLETLSRQAREAREAMVNGRYAEAVRLYEQMVKALPNEPGARFNLALALDAAARPREALKNLQQIKPAEAGNPKFWFLLGIEYQKLQQPAKAVDPLERAVKLAPADLAYRLELADACLSSGASARAAASFRVLAAERPNDARILAGLVRSQLAMSSDAYNALVQTAPGSSFRLALGALSEADKGDRTKVVALYNQALSAQPPAPWLNAELDAFQGAASSQPRNADAVSDAGHPLARLFHGGDLEGVVAQTAAAKTPEALYWRARACSELARASLTRIAALPPSAEAHELAGLALRQVGRWEDSLAEFREAATLAPNDDRLRAELAKAQWLSRHYEEAAKLLEQIVAKSPDRAEGEFELGDSLFNLGQPELALRHLRRATALSPDAFAIQAMLGRVLLQTGDSQEAAPVLERAAKHDLDGSIHFQLATAYRNLGRADLARQAVARQKEIEEAARRRAGSNASELRAR